MQTWLGKFCTVGAVSLAMIYSSTIAADPSALSASSASGPMQSSSDAAKPASSPAKPGELKQVWNLQNADIRAVIHTITQLTGRNFVIDPRVQGRVTIVSKTPMSVDQLYKVFLSMLQVLGYAAIPAGTVTKIVPAMNAKEYAGVPIAKKYKRVGNDNVILKVVPVYNVSAAQLVPILRPLMHEWGSIMAYTPSNTLILAGSADNVQRLENIVHDMDDHNASEIKELELKNANAEKLVKVLDKLQQDNRAEGKVTNVSYAADPESNSVLISGSKLNISSARRLIHRLDIKAAQDGGGVHVFHLRYLRAKNLVPVLSRLIGGKVQGADGGAAAPTAPTAGASTGTSNPGADNSSLGGPDSNSLANTPDQGPGLVAGGNSKVAIVAEEANNTVLISGPAQDVNKLKRVIKELDVRPMQVLVEAIIVRLDEALLRQLGIQWGTETDSSGDSSGLTASNGQNSASIPGNFVPGMGFIRHVTIQGLLRAIQNNGTSQILATPSIMVLNNNKAVIADGVNVGLENRSYATTGTGANLSNDDAGGVPFTTTQRTDVTLQLTVTPQISPNNTVVLKIQQKDRELSTSVNETQNTDPNNPTIETSTIATNVLVSSGDILVLGGLIKNQYRVNEHKIPILGSIPYFGKLFTYQDKQVEQMNLMVFLKPVIVGDRTHNQAVTAKRYDFMRGEQVKMATDQNLIRNLGETVLPNMRNPGRRLALPPPFPSHHG